MQLDDDLDSKLVVRIASAFSDVDIAATFLESELFLACTLKDDTFVGLKLHNNSNTVSRLHSSASSYDCLSIATVSSFGARTWCFDRGIMVVPAGV